MMAISGAPRLSPERARCSRRLPGLLGFAPTIGRERFLMRMILAGAPLFACRVQHVTSFPIFMPCFRRHTSQDRMFSLHILLAAFLPAYTPVCIRRRLLEWFWLMPCPKR